MDNAWLKREIASGLQALVALSLEGQPSAEILPLTADIWLAAMERRLRIEEVDAARLKAAFRLFFPVAVRWPAPAQILELLPPRPPQPALPLPKVSDEEHKKMVARVKLMIGSFMENWGTKSTRKGD